MGSSRYSGYDDRLWAIRSIVDMPGTEATTVDCGGNVSYDRSTALVLIEREATTVVLMRTMVYGPSKLCGTDPTVWAVDGTLAIGYGVFVVESTEGNGGCKRHTIGCSTWAKYCRLRIE